MEKADRLDAFQQIYNAAKTTNKKLKKIKQDTSLEKPISVDVLKTTKAMFYEEVVAILKSYKKE